MSKISYLDLKLLNGKEALTGTPAGESCFALLSVNTQTDLTAIT